MLDAQSARKVFVYDPETGCLLWRRSSRRGFVGREAGTINNYGYRQIRTNGRVYMAHRVAWLIMTGEWPVADIDHINLDRADNRWSNLREATRSQNKANSPRNARNTSGVKGVQWRKRDQRWRAVIIKDYKRYELGVFATKEAAKAAYDAKAVELFGEFARAA